MEQNEIDQLRREHLSMQETNAALEKKYKLLADKVFNMLETQQAYFKSNKDARLLRASKALETEVREILNPKPKQPTTGNLFAWLAL